MHFFAYDGEDEEWMRNFMEEMQEKGAKTVIVTRGTKGSIAYDGISYTEFGIIHAMSWIRWEPVTASLQAFYMVSYRENH